MSPTKVGDDIAKVTGDWKGLGITVKLTIPNRRAQIEVVPSASALIRPRRSLYVRGRSRRPLNTAEASRLKKLSALADDSSLGLEIELDQLNQLQVNG